MVKIIKSKRVVLATGEVAPATLKIEGGKIVQIDRDRYEEQVNGAEVLDVGDLVVMPGVVDCHVHVNEPGRTEWEGFQTATKAAAAGGVTTIVDMPLNSVPSTTSVEALNIKIHHVNKLSMYVDVALWGGVVPGNQDELLEMVEVGCRGFKCFMIPSGVDEFQWTREEDIRQALLKLKRAGVPLMFHAEIEIPGDLQETDGDVKNYDTFLSSRPDSMETKAVELVARLCTETKVPCHIVHLSSAQALPLIRKVKAEGSPLTVETTHHYLTLDAESVPCGATQYKCCPPIRSKLNQERLWEAIRKKDIDMVVSDHSPCTPDLKCLEEGNFIKAWGGIASVQFGLSLFWTGARQRNVSLADVVRLLCVNTANLCGLGGRKGSVKVGYDADLVIWDPDTSFKVIDDKIHHKWKLTPYLDMDLFGVVHKTILGGHLVYDSGNFMEKPMGKLILD